MRSVSDLSWLRKAGGPERQSPNRAVLSALPVGRSLPFDTELALLALLHTTHEYLTVTIPSLSSPLVVLFVSLCALSLAIFHFPSRTPSFNFTTTPNMSDASTALKITPRRSAARGHANHGKFPAPQVTARLTPRNEADGSFLYPLPGWLKSYHTFVRLSFRIILLSNR